MKIKITLKDTDALIDGIADSVDELKFDGLSEEEIKSVKELRKEEYLNLANKWFEYSEYLTVEIDTRQKTCTVLPAVSSEE